MNVKIEVHSDKAIKDLNHNPKVNPEEGIRRTVEWMKDLYPRVA